ncbi:hypothetical protein HK101_001275 [Irineochytrium annulatum]|nr:hypothetical protein HK101_001275 [Irineochytrium annulatum]
MTSVQDLVRRVNELQADFLNHVRQPTSPFHKDITRIRLALRDAYERVIFLDQELAASKDYEAAIFKVAHYRVIEEFRKRHKQVGSD